MKSLIILGEEKFLAALKGLLEERWEVQLHAEAEDPKLVCVTKEEEAGRSEAGQGAHLAS